MVGLKLADVAGANSQGSEHDLALARETKRKESSPIVLKRRDGAVIPEPVLKPRPQSPFDQQTPPPPPEGTSVPQVPPSQP
jgi:hypothetical protein